MVVARRYDADRRRRVFLVLAWAVALTIFGPSLCSARATGQQQAVVVQPRERDGGSDGTSRRRFASSADSVDWQLARRLANGARGFRLVISLFDRQLWAIIGADTVRTAPIAVGSGSSLEYQGRRWTFTTPRGARTIVAKDSLPVWVPPDWHYYEVARARGLVVQPLMVGRAVTLDDGRRLEIRSDNIGLVG